jgi:hypothetical protein
MAFKLKEKHKAGFVMEKIIRKVTYFVLKYIIVSKGIK